MGLCGALQILAAVEKQPRSSTDQTWQIYSALLQIASRDASSKRSTGPVLFPGTFTCILRHVNSICEQKAALSIELKLAQLIPVFSAVADYKSNAEVQFHSLTHSKYSVNHSAIGNTAEQQEMDNTEQKSTIKSIPKQINCRDKAIDGETHFTCISEMEEIWLNMLGRMQSSYLKDFLRHKVKLASLTITSGKALLLHSSI